MDFFSGGGTVIRYPPDQIILNSGGTGRVSLLPVSVPAFGGVILRKVPLPRVLRAADDPGVRSTLGFVGFSGSISA